MGGSAFSEGLAVICDEEDEEDGDDEEEDGGEEEEGSDGEEDGGDGEEIKEESASSTRRRIAYSSSPCRPHDR